MQASSFVMAAIGAFDSDELDECLRLCELLLGRNGESQYPIDVASNTQSTDEAEGIGAR